MSKVLKHRAIANFNAEVKVALMLCENYQVAKGLIDDIFDEEDRKIVKSFIDEYQYVALDAHYAIFGRFLNYSASDNVPYDLVYKADDVVRDAYFAGLKGQPVVFDWSKAIDGDKDGDLDVNLVGSISDELTRIYKPF